MRLLAHNGEINTLLGNINWMKSRLGLTCFPDIPLVRFYDHTAFLPSHAIANMTRSPNVE